jgi:hypothetical protein
VSNQKINECRLGLEIQLQNEIDEEIYPKEKQK